MIQTNKEYSKELVIDLLKEYKANEVTRFQMLADYYDGKSAITKKEEVLDKPDNRVVLNYPAYIVDMIQGYFIGQPIAYSSQEEELLEQIQDIFNYNDEQDENSELANIMGTKGIAYELLFADEEANVRFNELEPDNVFLVYDTKIIPEPRFGVKFDLIDEIEYVTVYTANEIIDYENKDDKLVELKVSEHYFGEVPIIPFSNNKKCTSDFDKVISLIDAMEIATSNSINDLAYFSDAYMYLVNMMGTEKEDIQSIREDRVILLDKEGEAGFLIKESNNQDSENIKDRLNQSIHKFANVPDMSDENFSANASGIAMAYKHFGLDQVVVNKERRFKTGVYKRLELICNFLNTKLGTDKYDYREIKLNFTRNKPVNEKENAEIANILKGLVSDQTAISYLTMVEDVTDEMERIESEKSAYIDLDKVVDEDEIIR